MTQATKFESWQTRPGDDWRRPPFESCSPNLLLLRDHLMGEHGGQDLGCHGNRDVRDGGSISTHAYGASFDWRYQNPGPGRAFLLSDIIPFLIDNSAELGVQAIHDYAGCRIWRPPGTSGRPADSDGWKTQRKKGNMGASWSLWVHVETHPDNFGDSTPIADRLATTLTTSTEQEIDMLQCVQIMRPKNYANVFAVTPWGARHLGIDSYYRLVAQLDAAGYESAVHVTDHRQEIKGILAQAGMTQSDLISKAE
jgi:hypothetical protein